MACAKEAVEQADQSHTDAKAAHSQAMVDVQKVRGDIVEPSQCADAALAHGILADQMELLFSQFLTTLRSENFCPAPEDEEFGEIKRGLASLVTSAAKRRKANNGDSATPAPSQSIAAASHSIQVAEQKAENAAKVAMDVEESSPVLQQQQQQEQKPQPKPAGTAASKVDKQSS